MWKTNQKGHVRPTKSPCSVLHRHMHRAVWNLVKSDTSSDAIEREGCLSKLIEASTSFQRAPNVLAVDIIIKLTVSTTIQKKTSLRSHSYITTREHRTMLTISFPTLAASLLLRTATTAPTAQQPYQHVIALSIDGMHGSDVEKYLAVRPNSTMASLLATGYEYTNAYTSAVRPHLSAINSYD